MLDGLSLEKMQEILIGSLLSFLDFLEFLLQVLNLVGKSTSCLLQLLIVGVPAAHLPSQFAAVAAGHVPLGTNDPSLLATKECH